MADSLHTSTHLPTGHARLLRTPALWRQRPWSDHTEAAQSPRPLQCQCAAAGTETVVGPWVPQSTPVLGIRN